MDTLRGRQELATLNEPGLYRLIFLSRKPEAERFKTWVFEEVLPQIRKSGGCAAAGVITRLCVGNERLRRSKTRPTPEDEREILNLYRQGYSKAQIHRELFRGVCCIKRILEKYEDAMDQMGLFDEELIAASRGKEGAA